MYKTFIAGLTAISMSLVSATPAHANGFDREDAGKLIIGLAAIAALNAALENRNRRSSEQASDRAARHPQGWTGHRDRRNALPSQCLREIETRYGQHRMLMRRCLERNNVQLSRLPNRCEVRLFTIDGPRNGYDPACMRQEGFRIDRRH
ncbi:hypothetical protein [Loktanella sp. S4079]|uniref:hypothetical protein n=1 Tax=Loktanella sp. S4079 TaxID=579483 RepID=UPI00069670F7|nr:hypothetical protein [Loktanella sp. S4079]